MVGFTVGLLSWLWCALFWLFVIVWTSYGIYRFIQDRIDEKKRDEYVKRSQETHKKEIEEAKRRIAKIKNKKLWW